LFNELSSQRQRFIAVEYEPNYLPNPAAEVMSDFLKLNGDQWRLNFEGDYAKVSATHFVC